MTHETSERGARLGVMSSIKIMFNVLYSEHAVKIKSTILFLEAQHHAAMLPTFLLCLSVSSAPC